MTSCIGVGTISNRRGVWIGGRKPRAVVVTVTVAVAPTATEAGLVAAGVQAAAVAATEQLIVTLELKPFVPVTAIV